MDKKKLYEIVFESDTRAGRIFDITLLFVILLSVVIVLFESVSDIRESYHNLLVIAEWTITAMTRRL